MRVVLFLDYTITTDYQRLYRVEQFEVGVVPQVSYDSHVERRGEVLEEFGWVDDCI